MHTSFSHYSIYDLCATWGHSIFNPHPPKDGMFLPRRVRIFFFSKVPTNNKPFGIHFSMGADSKLWVRILAILRWGADKK